MLETITVVDAFALPVGFLYLRRVFEMSGGGSMLRGT